MKEQKISIQNSHNEKLVGLMTAPSDKKERHPSIILAHGFGVTKEESGMFDNIANNLAKAGFMVFRFDFSGCGESEGDYSETSLSKLRDDLSCILDYVKSRPDVDDLKVGILGQSFGTATIIALKPKVQCLIMTSSVSHPQDTLKRSFADGFNPDGVSEKLKSSGKIIKIKSQFWADLNNYELLKFIKKINIPILFIHGSNDDKCPISEMEAYFKNANKPKKKVILKGADHGLRPQREEMQKLITKWFIKYL